MIRTAALLALLGTSAAQAADPSFDCAKAASSAEEAVCANPDLAALDRELARLYDLASKGPNMTPDRLAELRATQRGWVKGRDDCWKSDLGVPSCVRQEYALRIHDLRQGYADSRSANGASTGPFPYLCEELDTPISAVFVQTENPLAVLTWRDGFAVLPATPAASGARYAEGGTEFWTKGDEAMLTLPDTPGMSCRRDVMN